MLIRLLVGGVTFEVLAVNGAPPTLPTNPADALLTPTIYTDAVAGIVATTKQLLAAFGGSDGPTNGEAAVMAAAATAAGAVLSSGTRPSTSSERSASVAVHKRAAVDILCTDFYVDQCPYANQYFSREALEAAATAARVDWEHPGCLEHAAVTVVEETEHLFLWRGPAVGVLTFLYPSPVKGLGGNTAAAAAAAAAAEPPPPTAAELRSHPAVVWVNELPIRKPRSVRDQLGLIRAAYRVGVAAHGVVRFRRQFDGAWREEPGTMTAPAERGGGRGGGGKGPPAGPRATPAVPRGKGGKGHRKRQLTAESRGEEG